MSAMECPLCSDAAHMKFDWRDFLKHLTLFHAHHPDFKVSCRIDGCQRSFTNIRTYQNHVSSVHNWCKGMNSSQVFTEEESTTLVRTSSEVSGDDENDKDADDESSSTNVNAGADHEGMESTTGLPPCCSQELLQNSSAVFLLGLKEKYKLTQTALQGIIKGVTNLTQQRISYIQSQV